MSQVHRLLMGRSPRRWPWQMCLVRAVGQGFPGRVIRSRDLESGYVGEMTIGKGPDRGLVRRGDQKSDSDCFGRAVRVVRPLSLPVESPIGRPTGAILKKPARP